MKLTNRRHKKDKYSNNWNTPKVLLQHILDNGYKDYNPEGSFISPFYVNTSDFKNDKVFINPPFSILNKEEFLITIYHLWMNNNDILLLIPARTDTRYFHELLTYFPNITFIKGRLKFNDGKTSAPFPSILLDIKSCSDRYYKNFYGTLDIKKLEQEKKSR